MPARRVFVTALGRLSAPLDGSGLAPDAALGGRLSARLAPILEPGEPRLHGLTRLAAQQALAAAPGLDRLPPDAKGVFMSASKGGMEVFESLPLDPGTGLWRFLSSSPGQALRERLGWQGGGRNTPLACATGAYAIGLAFEDIRAGRLQAALAGAAEASLTPLVAAAFARAGVLSPARKSEDFAGPFDQDRAGFVLGEAGAAMLLESEEGLALSGHRPVAELKGWGCTCDAWHMLSPRPDGSQAARCMSLALEQAGLRPADVGYVNAHGSGTRAGDSAECKALLRVFGDASPPRVSSIKGATGHTLGASGALEAVVTVEGMAAGLLPGGRAVRRPMPEATAFLAGRNGSFPPGAALSLSMGFGGHNVALVFTRA